MQVVLKETGIWNQNEYGYFMTDTTRSLASLEPGLYAIDPFNAFPYLKKMPDPKQKILELDDAKSMEVFNEIKKFWTQKDAYKKIKKPFRRSFLLYGPPGVGKSFLLNLTTQHIIATGGLVIQMTPNATAMHLSTVLQNIKRVEPNRNVLVLLEDVDVMLEQSYNINALLNILDGIVAINNVIYIATTNYIERLEQRIMNRPNRFDKVIHIGYPDKKSRMAYLDFLLEDFDGNKKTGLNVEKWASDTKDFSFAHLTELVTSVMIFEESFEVAIKTINGMKRPEKTKDPLAGNVGFGE